MITCTKKLGPVPFGHRQPNHEGHCRLIHGHNWTFEITMIAQTRDDCGFVYDFGKMGWLKEILSRFDHALVLNQDDPQFQYLSNSLKDLATIVPVPDCSAEGLAKYFGILCDDFLRADTQGRVSVHKFTVFEDEKNSASWTH